MAFWGINTKKSPKQRIFIMNPGPIPIGEMTQMLREKSFEIVKTAKPFDQMDLKYIEKELGTCGQLWFFSPPLTPLFETTPMFKKFFPQEIRELITDFFYAGGSLYIWSDNPSGACASAILEPLFSVTIGGCYYGYQYLSLSRYDSDHRIKINKKLCPDIAYCPDSRHNYCANPEERPIRFPHCSPGIIPDHPISIGVKNFFEGATINDITTTDEVRPLIFGSDGIVAATYYDQGGRRAVIDGGFTKVCTDFWNPGTSRYVENAAKWLVSDDRFKQQTAETAVSIILADTDKENAGTNKFKIGGIKSLIDRMREPQH